MMMQHMTQRVHKRRLFTPLRVQKTKAIAFFAMVAAGYLFVAWLEEGVR